MSFRSSPLVYADMTHLVIPLAKTCTLSATIYFKPIHCAFWRYDLLFGRKQRAARIVISLRSIRTLVEGFRPSPKRNSLAWLLFG
ncbi:hypothetical protein ID858_09085 [Xenorhabdus sp. DI]|uniref:hypothetical protein n=1 Tax=Xenorhabdus doucetiae TaxID=351671 RepID=UPI0019C907C5|nr:MULTISPECIES: hypothetical protein [unclassified Xenorhabdus]MBD2786101.1 hypothetical protein [Xenorhabdus sp. 3]MBD2788662.1 hypothetical protein [Xenorhabdus sp. DI]